MDYYETPTKGIVMILANIASLFFGALISAVAVSLCYSERIRIMKRDAKSALNAEARDWYRRGYMRGMIDEKDVNYEKTQAKNTYQPLHV